MVQVSIQDELFGSRSDWDSFVQTEGKIINDIEGYINEEMAKINLLQRLLVPYKQSQQKALEDVPHYVQNPFNAFSLIKRLILDLDFIERIIKAPIGYERSKEVKLPNQEHLQTAVDVISRIHVAYNLNVKELSQGVLRSNYSFERKLYEEKFAPMSSSGCFEVGRSLYKDKHYESALPWLLEALALDSLSDEDNPSTLDMVDMIELICMSYIEIGDMERALEWTNSLLHLRPQLPDYELPLAISHLIKKVEENTTLEKPRQRETEATRTFHQLCRGEIALPNTISRRLTCRYLTDSHPYLRIAPVKAEQLYIDPFVMLVYDVVYEDEIEAIKKKDKSEEISTTWLTGSTSEAQERLFQRVHHFTYLPSDLFEDLHVVNYSIGDTVVQNDEICTMDGKKLATVLFYLSDDTQGGATVFMDLKLTVFPVKGAALFWTNLVGTGARDRRLQDSSCPVIRGSKWTAYTWLHASEDMLVCGRRPPEDDAF